MNSFSAAEMQVDSRSSKLIDAALTTNSAILKLDNGIQLWKYFKTPLYKKLCISQKLMEEYATGSIIFYLKINLDKIII